MPTETKSLEKSAKGSGREAPGVKAAHSGPTSGSLLTTAGNLALQRVSAPRFQRKARINRSSDLYEEEADRVSQHVLTLISAPMVQRKCACGGEGECDECKRKTAAQSETIRRRTDDLAVQRFSFGDDAASPADSASTTDTPTTADNPTATGNSAATPVASPGLIVEDNATDLGAGQMKKSEFLGQLRSPVNDAAHSALQGTVWASLGSVAIDPWLRQYSSQSAGQLERTIQQSVPGSVGVTSAGAYIPLVSARVQSAVGEWARTGKVPPGVPAGLPGMGAGVLNTASSVAQSGADALSNVASAVGGAVSDVAQGVSDAAASIGNGISSAAQGIGDTISDIGGMLFKAKDGGARAADDPRAIQSQLGAGESLDGSLQSRMGSAFGYDFSGVRVHKDNRAAQLSSDLNARAFTVGRNVAFGAGEYQPGTLIGDALIAHELAHVVQQGGATAQSPLQKGESGAWQSGESETNSLEDDADVSALRAVASLWSGAREGLANISTNAIPALKSGLKLQRCGASRPVVSQPSLATDDHLKMTWQAALAEGLALLRSSTARKGQTAGCAFPGSKPAKEWRYDSGSWRQITGGEEIRKYGVAFLPKKSPHESVDDLFNHLELWECDCAMFSELSWLYAWRHTLSDQEFDAKFSNLQLRPQDSTGLDRETHEVESIEMGLDSGNFDQMWANAAVGTKVVWKNTSVNAHSPWEFENAIKTVKGGSSEFDRYDAYPLGSDLSEQQVRRGLAENAEDFPGNTFTLLDSALQRLRLSGAPEPFLTKLKPLVGQTFIGKPAFIASLRDPAQALKLLRDQDPDRYNTLMKQVFEFARTPATESEKKSYVDKNIRRWEIQIPK